MQKTILLIIASFLVVTVMGLSACGRVSRPMVPEGSEYPKSYSVKL